MGAGAGALFSAAAAPTALGSSTGFHTTGMVAGGKATASWGITTSALQSAGINMAITGATTRDLDAVYKSGLVGAASGAFSASGGLGLAKAWGSKSGVAKFAGRIGYQSIGTAGRSIGNNWVHGRSAFSRIVVGAGPVNLTFGKNQKLFQVRDNLMNIAFNSIGIANWAYGGFGKSKLQIDFKNLTAVYSGGFLDKAFNNWTDATGAHTVLSTANPTSSLLAHEFNHIWYSRALGDLFIANYFFQGVFPAIMGEDQYFGNYFERIGEFGF